MIPYSLSKIDSTGWTNSLSSTTNTEKISIVALKIYNYVTLNGKEIILRIKYFNGKKLIVHCSKLQK